MLTMSSETAAPAAATAPEGPIPDWTLEAVVGAAAAGDERAWAELVRRFDGMIGSIGRRHGLGEADVAELRQTVWLRLVEHLVRIQYPERIGGWLSTTARRESLSILGRASRHRYGMEEVLANTADPALAPIDASSMAEVELTALRAAWGRLQPRCRRLLSLLMADDAPGYSELSTLLQMPVGSIGPTRGRCVEHLRRLVAEEGLLQR